jgi:hypothetical protein
MSDESDNEAYSSFWPLLIVALALIGWFGYQAIQSYKQKSALNAEFEAGVPTITQAQTAQSKLYAVAQDLIQLGAKDANAAQIVKEAQIQVHKADDSSSSAASPGDSSDSSETNKPASNP